jgi:hypothetical protein
MEKNFNIVYDCWDGDNPIPNTKNIYGNRNSIKDPHNLILHYINDTTIKTNKFKIKRCKVLDVSENPSEKFYYIINYGSTLSDLFDYENLNQNRKIDFLTQEIKNMLNENDNFYVIFLNEHEPDDFYGYELLIKYIEDNNLNASKFFLINNNSNLVHYQNHFETSINTYKLNFIPHSSTKVLHRIGGVDFVENKIGKFFMCFNKSPKKHRYGLLMLLLKNNLLTETNWSLVPTYDCHFGKSFMFGFFNDLEIYMLEKELTYFKNLKYKISDYELDDNYFEEFKEINREKLPLWVHVPESLKSYENSYVNIITESCFQQSFKNIHISEKSFKPFYYYQFPLILSTPNHIQTMRETYGLDFYDDIINHDYNNEIDDKKRLTKFIKEIVRLNNMKEELIKFYSENKNRFLSNKIKVENILNIVDKDYLFFESLI